MTQNDGTMIPVYSPATESEAAVISALLDAHEIPFYIRGGAIGKLIPGMQIKDYNTQTFMVPAESYELARELLAEFIKPTHVDPPAPLKKSFWRTLRVLFEAFFFGWIVPGARWDKKDK